MNNFSIKNKDNKINIKNKEIKSQKRYNEMVDRIQWDTVSYLPFNTNYIFFDF